MTPNPLRTTRGEGALGAAGGPEEERRSVWEAMGRLAEASQRLMLDRLELVRLETKDDMRSFARTLILVLGALPILILGWVFLMIGLLLASDPFVPMEAGLAILGLLHVALGGVGTYIGVSKLRADEKPNEEGP